MFNCLTRSSLTTFISATFLGVFMTPTVAIADWIGTIGPRDEAPAGQAEESGFADDQGQIWIQGGGNLPGVDVTFEGVGMIYLETFRADYSVIDQRTLTGPDIGFSLFTGFPAFPDQRHRIFLPDGLWAHNGPNGNDTVVGVSIEMTGSFYCRSRQNVCDGPQLGRLSFSLEIEE